MTNPDRVLRRDLASFIAARLHEKYVITHDQAQQMAQDAVRFLEAVGMDVPSKWEQVEESIRKSLRENLTWRNPEDKKNTEQQREDSVKGYQAYLANQRDSWSKKW